MSQDKRQFHSTFKTRQIKIKKKKCKKYIGVMFFFLSRRKLSNKIKSIKKCKGYADERESL